MVTPFPARKIFSELACGIDDMGLNLRRRRHVTSIPKSTSSSGLTVGLLARSLNS
jgi:hypothetical protein